MILFLLVVARFWVGFVSAIFGFAFLLFSGEGGAWFEFHFCSFLCVFLWILFDGVFSRIWILVLNSLNASKASLSRLGFVWLDYFLLFVRLRVLRCFF